MPFGMKNAPQIFQRRVDKIFEPIKEFCAIYVDDILIFSDTKEQRISQLEEFASLCKKHGILLSEKKVEVARGKYNF